MNSQFTCQFESFGQACQGEIKDPGVTLQRSPMTATDGSSMSPNSNSQIIPTNADFLIVFSSAPGKLREFKWIILFHLFLISLSFNGRTCFLSKPQRGIAVHPIFVLSPKRARQTRRSTVNDDDRIPKGF